MIELDIKADIKQVERHLTRTQRKHIPKATVRGLNRAITKVRTETRRDLSKRMGLPQKRIKDSFILSKAAPTRLSATLLGVGRPIRLIHFKGTRQTRQGVKSSAYGVRRLYHGTFITAVGRGGHRGVFKRVGKARLPIRELYGPGVPQSMSEEAVERNMHKTGRLTFVKEFIRQLKRKL